MSQYAAYDVSGAWIRLWCLLTLVTFVFDGEFAVTVADEVRTGVKTAASANNSDLNTTPQNTKPSVGENVKVETKAQSEKAKEPQETDLLANELMKEWQHFSSKDGVALGAVWQVTGRGDDKQLVCMGEPQGFLYTRKQYADFELTFEWNVPDANANSGVLIYTQDEPRLWPTSMQVQLHQPQAGDIFPSGDAEGNTTQAPPKLTNEVGKWNKCRIRSVKGQLSVEINGTKAGEVSGCNPSKGFIALQSEGSKTVFRRLILRELTDPDAAKEGSKLERSVEKPKLTNPAATGSDAGFQKNAG